MLVGNWSVSQPSSVSPVLASMEPSISAATLVSSSWWKLWPARVAWFASIFNFIISIATFYTLEKFELNINYCFFYSILVAILAYPSAGTPYVDHQSAFLSVIAIYFFVLALKTNCKIYWLIVPIILGISFLTKQAPDYYYTF